MGRVWVVKFTQQEWALYPDHQKYRYIAHILSLCNGNPKTHDSEYSIHNVELYEKVNPKAAEKDFHENGDVLKELSESDLSDTLSANDIGSWKKVGYKLVEQLQDAKEGGNQDFIEKARENLARYRSHLNNQYGIKTVVSEDQMKISFKVRYRPPKEIEKMRQVVKNQLKNATKDFDRMPRFKSHLQHSLKMESNKTCYSPESPTSW